MHEIERKFLLRDRSAAIRESLRSLEIEQCYLRGSTGDWAIRVRRTDTDVQTFHHMTLKKKVSHAKSIEVESPISPDFYAAMVAQCGQPLRKTRHEILRGEHLWEVDVFHDLDLVLAEIELDHEDEEFSKPTWLGREVTGKKRYSNKNLAKMLSR